MRAVGVTGSTRNQIVTSLRQGGSLSVNELAAKVKISSMGVRQHLASLEKDGLVTKKQYHQPIGRPCNLYRLTDQADSIFPKFYDKFIIGILNDISEHEGRKKLDLIFKWRCQRLWNLLHNNFTQEKLLDRTRYLIKMMNDAGNIAQVKKDNGSLIISFYNCPIYAVAKNFPLLCQYDQRLMGSLLNADLKQVHSFAYADNLCEFVVSNMNHH